MDNQTTSFVIPAVVTSHFHIREGDTVADFGSGVGYFIPELSKRAGPTGRVYACEIQKALIERLGAQAHEMGNHNVHPLWCDIEEEDGVKVLTGTVDIGILINTLFSVEDKDSAIKEMARTLRSGGKFFVVDWTESFGGLGPTPEHIVSEEDVKALFESNGFIFDAEYPAGAHHYGLAFRKL